MGDLSSQPIQPSSDIPGTQPIHQSKADVGQKDQNPNILPNATPEIQALPKEEQQKAAVLVILMKALIDSLVVGSKGMLARSKGLSSLNRAMLQLEQMIAQDKLIPVQSIHDAGHSHYNWRKAKRTSWTVQTNRGQIQIDQTINRGVMEKQMVVNLKIGQLQQSAETGDSDSDAAMQALEMVVHQITFSLEVMKQITYDACMTKAPRG